VKILVFEYITGGGFNKQELPDSLAGEGRLMLTALLDNLTRLNGFEVTVMMDWRLIGAIDVPGVNNVVIGPEHDIYKEFSRLVAQSDLVWPIAPEFDGILQTLCRTVETLGKVLLTSPATAVGVAGNKFKTFELLTQHQIATVPTRMLCLQDVGKWREHDCMDAGGTTPRTGEVELRREQQSRATQGAVAEERKLDDESASNDWFKTRSEWMVKPVDGAGCADSQVIADRQELERMAAFEGKYIVQPHLKGEKISLSCLFKQGRGWLICANLQRFELINRQYHLAYIIVNHHPDLGAYQQLIDQTAYALPDLWGYVGIDLIETVRQIRVLEINPRLSTSFVGIHEALGVNIAEVVLQLLHGEPTLKALRNRSVTVQAKQEAYAN
jgi:predicted ATP-grasp superfamily ATP-dependent carboligase